MILSAQTVSRISLETLEGEDVHGDIKRLFSLMSLGNTDIESTHIGIG